jgi:predicted dehydrogenase
MGQTHAVGWAETDAELVGFTSKPIDHALPVAEQYNAKVYPDFESMLPDIDIVDICVPTHLHYEMVLKAAAAGKHVICEKPLAYTVEEGWEMVNACKIAGVKLYVAHVVRFFPEYANAKSVVEQGKIGTPAVIRLSRESFQPHKAEDNWYLDFSKSGGLLMDLMIHDFDYARWIAGDVEKVFAKTITSTHHGAKVDHGLAILTHKNGIISHIEGSWAYPKPVFKTSFEIAGADGLITYDSVQTTPISIQLHKTGEEGDAAVAVPTSPAAESPYTTEIKAFLKAIQTGAPVRVTAEDGLAALQIARAAIESAQTGKAITLETLREVQA